MGFYGRRMVPEPLLKVLKKLDDAGITEEDLAALAGLAEELGDINTDLEGKQDKLTAGDGIEIDEDNVISATGGSDNLYCHYIYVNGTGGLVCFNLITNNSTPFTIATLISHLQTISVGKSLNIPASGYVDNGVFDYNGAISFIYVDNGSLEEVEYNYVDNGVIDHNAQSLTDLINSNCTISDGVVQIL